MEKKKKKYIYFYCQCCFNKKRKINGSFCNCNKGHTFCNDCILKYIHIMMGEGRPSTKCIAMSTSTNSCDGEITYEELSKCLPQETLIEMTRQEITNSAYKSHMRNMFVCAHCGYMFQLVNMKKYRVKYCPICKKGTCVLCGRKEHPNRKCKDVKYEEECKKKGFSICPNCKLEFIKDRGCNMMKCPRCDKSFCFVCGKFVSDYSHFSNAKVVPSNKCPLRNTKINKMTKINYEQFVTATKELDIENENRIEEEENIKEIEYNIDEDNKVFELNMNENAAEI